MRCPVEIAREMSALLASADRGEHVLYTEAAMERAIKVQEGETGQTERSAPLPFQQVLEIPVVVERRCFLHELQNPEHAVAAVAVQLAELHGNA